MQGCSRALAWSFFLSSFWFLFSKFQHLPHSPMGLTFPFHFVVDWKRQGNKEERPWRVKMVFGTQDMDFFVKDVDFEWQRRPCFSAYSIGNCFLTIKFEKAFERGTCLLKSRIFQCQDETCWASQDKTMPLRQEQDSEGLRVHHQVECKGEGQVFDNDVYMRKS